jgi:ubiquinone/menaquinone biosynthesis C-methylase UbiE
MPENNAAFVGAIPENYDRYLGPVLFEPYANDLVARLDIGNDGSVLELACGTGIVTRRLRERLAPGSKIVATDLNEAMLSYAQLKLKSSEAIEWKQADATDLPFQDQSFDAVVCQFGVMFFPDKEQAAREAYRVLKPGGVFLFNVWDAIEENDLPHIAHTIISKFFDDKPPNFYEIPFSFHDQETIAALLSQAGFRNIESSIVSTTAEATSASEVTRGLVHGNPVIAAIRECDESQIPAIEGAVASQVAAQCGDAPVRARMRAVVCSAVR